jgi:acetate kinase
LKTNETLHVLALNSGSSSLKFGLYATSALDTRCLLDGEVQAIGQPGSSLRATDGRGHPLRCLAAPIADQQEAVVLIGRLLTELALPTPQAIGHRIVHGGPKLQVHGRIDAEMLRLLEQATPFAALHMPAALAVIRFALAHFPGVPEVACFDTEFHAGLPAVASTLPLPAALRAQGLRRYGFHGLSCASIVRQLGARLPERLVIAHLGNGASVTAVRQGRSVDTSMGMTPSGGLVMGTRSGDLDPGVLVYLAREQGYDAAQLEDLVDHRSGLLGISGVASDMRALHAACDTKPDARLAIDMFCHVARKQIGAMAAVLDGIDLLVFTGGIGEHDALVRAAICGGLGHLGIQAGAAAETSEGRVLVLPSQEDAQIALSTWETCRMPRAAEPANVRQRTDAPPATAQARAL